MRTSVDSGWERIEASTNTKFTSFICTVLDVRWTPSTKIVDPSGKGEVNKKDIIRRRAHKFHLEVEVFNGVT